MQDAHYAADRGGVLVLERTVKSTGSCLSSANNFPNSPLTCSPMGIYIVFPSCLVTRFDCLFCLVLILVFFGLFGVFIVFVWL